MIEWFILKYSVDEFCYNGIKLDGKHNRYKSTEFRGKRVIRKIIIVETTSFENDSTIYLV